MNQADEDEKPSLVQKCCEIIKKYQKNLKYFSCPNVRYGETKNGEAVKSIIKTCKNIRYLDVDLSYIHKKVEVKEKVDAYIEVIKDSPKMNKVSISGNYGAAFPFPYLSQYLAENMPKNHFTQLTISLGYGSGKNIKEYCRNITALLSN